MRSVKIGFSMALWGGDGVSYLSPPVGRLDVQNDDVRCREKKIRTTSPQAKGNTQQIVQGV